MFRMLLLVLFGLFVGFFPATASVTRAEGSETAAIGVPGGVNLRKGAAINQGYLYSRYSFGALLMASEMGIPMEVPMDMLMQAMRMTDRGPAERATGRPERPTLQSFSLFRGGHRLARYWLSACAASPAVGDASNRRRSGGDHHPHS